LGLWRWRSRDGGRESSFTGSQRPEKVVSLNLLARNEKISTRREKNKTSVLKNVLQGLPGGTGGMGKIGV